LKNQLGGAFPKKVTPEPKETQRSSRINVKDHANIDHIVSKKANKFYREEVNHSFLVNSDFPVDSIYQIKV